MSTTPTPTPTPTPAPKSSTSVFGKIKHFFGIVWHGVAIGASDVEKVGNEVIADGAKIEPELELAADVTSMINPAAGSVAKLIVTGGFTALGAFTEAFEASESTVSKLLSEAPEFTQVTVRTEALQQIHDLWQTYKGDFDKVKDAFVQQAQAGASTPAAIPAASVAKK